MKPLSPESIKIIQPTPFLTSTTTFFAAVLFTLSLNYSFLRDYFHEGLPAGWDASGHFTLSQLYYDQAWPSIGKMIESFFQGFHFPRFYPPLFYWTCGTLYWLFSNVDRVLVFKALVVSSVVILPALLGLFGMTLGFSKKASFTISILSTIFLSTSEGISRYQLGFGPAVEMGLSTQALGGCSLVFLLTAITCQCARWLKIPLVAIAGTLFLLSNFHLIIGGTLIIIIFLALRVLREKISVRGISSAILLSIAAASPWYWNAFIHRMYTPATPLGQLPVSVEVLGFIMLGLVPLVVIHIFDEKFLSRSTLFCTAALGSIPILLLSLQPLGLAIAWQPERLWSVFNLFLPIYMVTAYGVLRDSIVMPPRLLGRLRLGAAAIFVVLLIGFRPLEVRLATLSDRDTEAMHSLTAWLHAHPIAGYDLVPFTWAGSPSVSTVDIALSHYIALAGERGIWAVFRESSFNSIFSTTVRNFLSTTFESYGIPQSIPFSDYSWLPVREKIHSLPRWGIERIIVRSENADMYTNSGAALAVEYDDTVFTVLRLKEHPVLSFESKEAFIFVGKPMQVDNDPNKVNFAKIGEFLTVDLNDHPPVLLFDSCENLERSVPEKSLHVACAVGDDKTCCTDAVQSAKDIFRPALLNPIPVQIRNQSAERANEAAGAVVVAPWRDANLKSS